MTFWQCQLLFRNMYFFSKIYYSYLKKGVTNLRLEGMMTRCPLFYTFLSNCGPLSHSKSTGPRCCPQCSLVRHSKTIYWKYNTCKHIKIGLWIIINTSNWTILHDKAWYLQIFLLVSLTIIVRENHSTTKLWVELWPFWLGFTLVSNFWALTN